MDQTLDQNALERNRMVLWESVETEGESITTVTPLIRQLPNTGENLSLTPQGGLQQKRGTKKWEKCGRSSNLLLRQLCEARARVLDIIDRPPI